MKVGDIVKSLDFPGSHNCYMIGKVTGVHYDGTFRAKFIKRVWLGNEDRKCKIDYFSAPAQGNHFLDNETDLRVIVIG